MVEFKEYENPEGADYDLKASSLEESSSSIIGREENPYEQELLELVGFLDEEEILAYGLTLEEYLHPTAEVVAKVKSQVNLSDEVVTKQQ